MPALVEREILQLCDTYVCCSTHSLPIWRCLDASLARDRLGDTNSDWTMPYLTDRTLISLIYPGLTTLKLFEFIKFVSTRKPRGRRIPFDLGLSFVTRIMTHSRMLLCSLYWSNVELFIHLRILYPAVHYVGLLFNVCYFVLKSIFRTDIVKS